MSRLKNSITPRVSPPTVIGKANPVCRPSRAASGDRGKLGARVMSGIHTGLPLAKT